MTGLTNSLTDLAEEIRILDAAAEDAQRTAADKMIAAGKMLVVAKDECPHGQWAAFLDRAGVHERKARRLMQLARSGLKADTVSEIGGLKAALIYIAKRDEFTRTMLPEGDNVLLVSHDDPFSDDVKWPMGCVWADQDHPGYFHVGVLDFDTGYITKTRKPIRPEPITYGDDTWWPLWECLRQLMRLSPVDCYFQHVPDFVGLRKSITSFCLSETMPKSEVGHG